jgi:hypothetical protein
VTYRHQGSPLNGLLVKDLWDKIILDLFPVLILVLISCIGVFVEVPHPFNCSSIFFSFYDYLARKIKNLHIGWQTMYIKFLRRLWLSTYNSCLARFVLFFWVS